MATSTSTTARIKEQSCRERASDTRSDALSHSFHFHAAEPAESSRADNDVRVEKRTRLADLVCDEEATELGSWPPWKLKSRFVVCGYSQRQGIDYERAFSSTLRASSFRTIACHLRGSETPVGSL